MTITQSFLSCGSQVQIATENKTGKENIFPDSSRNYNTEIKKGMKILQRNWRGIQIHILRHKEVGRC
jgi:hypothetical protein